MCNEHSFLCKNYRPDTRVCTKAILYSLFLYNVGRENIISKGHFFFRKCEQTLEYTISVCSLQCSCLQFEMTLLYSTGLSDVYLY